MVLSTLDVASVLVTEPTPPTVAEVIAQRVRKFRAQRGWSVRQLAEECAKAGAPQLTIASLGNIERGQDPEAKRKRRDVTVEELLVLGYVLNVPPVLLMLPYGELDEVSILPSVRAHPIAALDWINGRNRSEIRETFGVDEVPGNWPIGPAAYPLIFYGDISSRLRHIEAEKQLVDDAKREAARAQQRIAEVTTELEVMKAEFEQAAENDELAIGLRRRIAELQGGVAAATGLAAAYVRDQKIVMRSYVNAIAELATMLNNLEHNGLLLPPVPKQILADIRSLEKITESEELAADALGDSPLIAGSIMEVKKVPRISEDVPVTKDDNGSR